MNLHGIAGPIISAVNPMLPAYFEGSNSSSILEDGRQVASFLPPVVVVAQVQQLTSRDLQKLESLNLQQNGIAIYLYGVANGVVRISQKGGDLITVPTGPSAGVYLVTVVLEQWPDWVKVSATLQNQPVDPTKTPSLDFSDLDNSQNAPGGTPA